MHRIYDNLFCFRTIDKVSFQFLGDVEAAEVKMKCERILFVHAIWKFTWELQQPRQQIKLLKIATQVVKCSKEVKVRRREHLQRASLPS